jgi:hypothetical protein
MATGRKPRQALRKERWSRPLHKRQFELPVWLGGMHPFCGGPWWTGMLWRIVMVSSPIKKSFTTSRSIRLRSLILSVSAAPRRRARNAVRVSSDCL